MISTTQWEHAAATVAERQREYTTAYTKALMASAQKTAGAREAEASLLAADLKASLDLAKVEEQAARWRIQFEIASARGGGEPCE